MKKSEIKVIIILIIISVLSIALLFFIKNRNKIYIEKNSKIEGTISTIDNEDGEIVDEIESNSNDDTNVVYDMDEENTEEKVQKSELVEEKIEAGEFSKLEDENTLINTSEKISEEKEELGLSISNVKLKVKDGNTTMSVKITNNGDSKQEEFMSEIVLLDKQGNEIGRIPMMISALEKGQYLETEARINGNFGNAYDYKIVKK